MCVSDSTSSVIAGSRMPNTNRNAVENHDSFGVSNGGLGGVACAGARLVCMRPG
jgi:hypothetical protein